MKPKHFSEVHATGLVADTPYHAAAEADPGDDIELESCGDFDWIVVTTRGSVYDVIVLSGGRGEVLVRGGRFFPEFRRVTIAGSIVGACGVKLGHICVGLSLELLLDGRVIVTSTIQAISRHPLSVVGAQS
jgi:hypothetical protein